MPRVPDHVNHGAERRAFFVKLPTRINSQFAVLSRDEKVITAKADANLQPRGELTSSDVETCLLPRRVLPDNVARLFVFAEHSKVAPTNSRSERKTQREADILKVS